MERSSGSANSIRLSEKAESNSAPNQYTHTAMSLDLSLLNEFGRLLARLRAQSEETLLETVPAPSEHPWPTRCRGIIRIWN